MTPWTLCFKTWLAIFVSMATTAIHFSAIFIPSARLQKVKTTLDEIVKQQIDEMSILTKAVHGLSSVSIMIFTTKLD